MVCLTPSASVLCVALLAGLAAGQISHQVIVGGSSGRQFSPNNIQAGVGDTVTFIFEYANHTVTQSSFAAPCTQLVNASTNAQGFNSGFQAVPQNASQNPAWTLQVTGAAPIWYFCAQVGHCTSGMVGAINAPATGNKTFSAFQAAAMGAAAGAVPAAQVSSGVGADATGAISSAPAPSGSASASASASATGNSEASTLRVSTALVALVAVAGAFAWLG